MLTFTAHERNENIIARDEGKDCGEDAAVSKIDKWQTKKRGKNPGRVAVVEKRKEAAKYKSCCFARNLSVYRNSVLDIN